MSSRREEGKDDKDNEWHRWQRDEKESDGNKWYTKGAFRFIAMHIVYGYGYDGKPVSVRDSALLGRMSEREKDLLSLSRSYIT